jgi:hypothetical protein
VAAVLRPPTPIMTLDCANSGTNLDGFCVAVS